MTCFYSFGETVQSPRHLSGRPGTRAPHIELNRPDERVTSILDWFGRDWVLLTGPAGGDWVAAAGSLERSDLSVHQVGADHGAVDLPTRWSAAYGVGAAGAVLVRPDGFIAWRAPRMVSNPADTLRAVRLPRLMAPR